MKKITSLLIACAMLASMSAVSLSAQAAAVESESSAAAVVETQPSFAAAPEQSGWGYLESGNFYYIENEDGTVTVIGFKEYKSKIEIPSEINGKKVTVIGQGAGYSTFSPLVTEVVLPNTIKEIQSGAFFNWENLKEINIPESVESIESLAFYCCKSLEEVYIPKNVAFMAEYYEDDVVTTRPVNDSPFFGCRSLKKITVDKDNKTLTSVDGVLYNKDMTVLIQYPAEKTGDSFTVPETVKEIADGTGDMGYGSVYGVFAGNRYLKTVVLPESLEKLGRYAFINCDNITSVNIPEKVKLQEYGYYPYFSGCKSLKNITVSDNNTDFSSDGIVLFNKNKTEIYEVPNGIEGNYSVPETVTNLSNIYGRGLFENCVNLKNIVIPTSVQYLPNSCFKNCVSLESCTLPGTIKELGWYAFYNCVSLKNISIPSSVTSISGYAFYHCTSLTNITLPDSVESISSYAFTNCYNLTSITLSNKLSFIGDNAFWKCKALSNVTIPESVEVIDEWAFQACESLNSVNIPKNVSNIGKGAFGEIDDITVTVDEANPTFTMVDNVLFTKDMKKLVGFYDKDKKDYTVPDGVEEIASNAFWKSNLETISFPNSLKTIGDEAFMACNSISEVTLPGVETLGVNSFSSCSNLKKVNLSESIIDVKARAFELSYQLEEINVNGNNGELVSVDGVVYTKDMAYIAAYPLGKKGDYLIPDSVVGALAQKDNGYFDENRYSNSTFGAVFAGAKGLTAFKVNSTNDHFTVDDGVLFAKTNEYEYSTEVTKLVAYPSGKQGEYTIPSYVEIVEPIAFTDCSGLTKINIPESVKRIGNYEEYDDPQMATTQWYIPFYLCENLEEITVSENNPNYSSYDGVLYNKQRNHLLDAPDARQSIEFPKSIEESWGGLDTYNAFTEMTGKKDFYFTNRYSIISDTLLQFAGKDSDVTVHGYKGSTAEMFAIVNDLKFVDMEEPAVTGKMGDLDGDDDITSADSLYILRASVGLENFTPEQMKLCDVDGDNAVTAADSLEVLRYSVGLPTTANIG